VALGNYHDTNNLLAEPALELPISICHRFGDDPQTADDRHEIGVALPARHDVRVYMVGLPGPGHCPDVHPTLNPVG